MRDLIGERGGTNRHDLSQRMADNVIEALVGYMETETSLGAERVHAYSTALSSLSLLAVAEQLQSLVAALTPQVLADLVGATGAARTMPGTINMCLWSHGRNGWFGACGYEAPDDIDDIIAGQNEQLCPGCGGKIYAIRAERVA